MKVNIFNFYLILFVMITPWASFLVIHIPGLNQVIYTILTILVFFTLLKNGFDKKQFFIKILHILILFILIVNLISLDNIIEIIKLPLIIVLSTYSLILSKYLTYQKKINKNSLMFYSIYILIIILIFIVFDKINGISYYNYKSDAVTEGIAGNISKYAAILFPIIAIFMYLQKYFLSFVQFILILLTQRRSALLGEVIFIMLNIFPYVFSSYIIKQNFKKIILTIFFIFIVSLFFVDQIGNVIDQNLNRLGDISEGSAGGRKVFWALALNFYLSFDTFNLFFGNPGALPQFLDQKFGLAIGAHTDILDFLCNYGAIGLILYLSIYISIFKYFWNYRKLAKKESVTGCALIIAMFFLSITTGGFFYSLNLMYFIFTGYLVGVIELKRENNYE